MGANTLPCGSWCCSQVAFTSLFSAEAFDACRKAVPPAWPQAGQFHRLQVLCKNLSNDGWVPSQTISTSQDHTTGCYFVCTLLNMPSLPKVACLHRMCVCVLLSSSCAFRGGVWSCVYDNPGCAGLLSSSSLVWLLYSK